MNDREALRRHIEAVWDVSVPSLAGAEVTLAPSHSLPPWLLYRGKIGVEHIVVWRSQPSAAERARLLALAQHADDAPTVVMEMRREVILLPPLMAIGQGESLARRLTAQDAALIAAFAPASAAELLLARTAPCVGVIVAGRLVSVAHSSRRTAVACELGIDTLPEARQQGYALAATRLWTTTVQQEGLLPIYSALAANTASRRLAAAAGYTLLATGVYGPMPAGHDE